MRVVKHGWGAAVWFDGGEDVSLWSYTGDASRADAVSAAKREQLRWTGLRLDDRGTKITVPVIAAVVIGIVATRLTVNPIVGGLVGLAAWKGIVFLLRRSKPGVIGPLALDVHVARLLNAEQLFPRIDYFTSPVIRSYLANRTPEPFGQRRGPSAGNNEAFQ